MYIWQKCKILHQKERLIDQQLPSISKSSTTSQVGIPVFLVHSLPLYLVQRLYSKPTSTCAVILDLLSYLYICSTKRNIITMFPFIYGSCALFILLILKLFQTHRSGKLNKIPGPIVAGFSNLWRILAVYHGDMHRRNVALHEKFGQVVRIGPRHICEPSVSLIFAILYMRSCQCYTQSYSF